MEKSRKLDVTGMKFLFFWTAVWFIAAHGYRFSNNLYTSDSLVEVFQDDIYWQRSLGRFMQPLTMMLRGTICAPWLIGCIALCFFAVSGYLIAEILGIRNRVLLAGLAAVLVCNETLTASAASFLPWVDIYSVALFFAVLGVWLYQRGDMRGYLLGSLAFVVCMGFYQAYIDVALGLLLMTALQRLWNKEELKAELIRDVKYLIGMAAAGLTYFAAYKAVCLVHHVTEADSYNSLSGLGDYAGVSIGKLTAGAYANVFSFLFRPGVFASTYLLGQRVSYWWTVLLEISVLVCFGVILLGMVLLNRRNQTKLPERIAQAVILIALPLALNAVFFLSRGMEHDLMKYSFFLIYAVMVCVLQECGEKVWQNKKYACYLMIPLCLLIWNNIVFSNQIYFKIDMEDRAALSMATRIVCDIENTEGYEYGVTPVAFVGLPDNSDHVREVDYLREVRIYGNGKTPFTYQMSMGTYLTSYLNVNMNIVDADGNLQEIKAMPSYPAKGSVGYVNDVLVVKLSD